MPLLVLLALLSLPTTAHAEVSDKIPETGSLALECAVVLALTASMILARGRLALRLGVMGALLLVGLAMVSGLRYSDIGSAVTAEKGELYVGMVWQLLVVPAGGVIGGLARRLDSASRSIHR